MALQLLSLDQFIRDRDVLKTAVCLLAVCKENLSITALQINMELGFARAGKLYDAVCEIPIIKENGGLTWLRDFDTEKLSDVLNYIEKNYEAQ